MSRDLGHKNCKPMHDIDINTSHEDQDQPIFYMKDEGNLEYLFPQKKAPCLVRLGENDGFSSELPSTIGS